MAPRAKPLPGLSPLEVNFCEWHKIWIQFLSFTYGYPIIPAPFIEETAFSPLNIFGFLEKY